MIYNNIDPILFSIGPLSIRYYGLAYVIGLIGTYLFLKLIAKSKNYNTKFNENDVDDIFIYIMLGLILGARIGYILIYNFQFYLANPLIVFQMWRGGMSFHGGLIGVILGIALFVKIHNKKLSNKKNKTKKEKLEIYDITDYLTIPAAFGLAVGRIANFTNHELFGRVTEMPWGVKFRSIEGYRHPSQIYESFYSIILGLIQWFLLTKDIAKGILTWSFISLYGFFRFITEFFREPDLHIGVDGFLFGLITMGQALSIIMIISGLVMINKIYKQACKKYE